MSDLFEGSELGDKVAELRANLSNLQLRDQDFAISLVGQWERRHFLSEKQAACVGNLLNRLNAVETGTKPVDADMSPVIALFDKVARNLKFPKLTFDETAVGLPLRLQRTAGGKEPGSVCATDGGPYGSNRFYGRIHRNGTFEAGRDCMEELLPFLTKLGTDTANVAAAYGHKSGACCFCDTKLTDERSTFAGYGATCAKHWSMPYPTKKEVREAEAGQKKLPLAA